MIDQNRLETTPIDHVRNLFKSINDGKIVITYYDPIDPPYSHTYKVSCTYADLDEFVLKYTNLIEAFCAIGKTLGAMGDSDKAEDLLTANQYEVWKTYIRDFDEKFDAGNYDLDELYDRRSCGDELTDDENDVLDKHYEWLQRQGLKRLLDKGTSVVELITRARRYVYLVSKNAPQQILDEEARCFAEELIVYSYFVSA